MNAGALAHELDRLTTTARVLYVAAHPDDENTRLLTYLANVRHLEVAYLSMTRGGGGQNLIGPEQGELLDVIRTEELLAARALDGARQRFTRARDFGYSKSAAETLAVWGHERTLGDVVRIIRTFQPDLIITRFTETPPNHGHHTASALLAREAFAAAADPARFPEHKLPPWQAVRLVHNVSNFPGSPPPPAGALELDVGAYDPRSGLSTGELAARSRSQHKSQGFGVPGERGPILERFVTVAGAKPLKDLFEGVDLGWSRVPGAGALAKALGEAQRTLVRDAPERALPALARAHAALAALPDSARVLDARRSLERVMASAAGLFVRATATTATVTPGSRFDLTLELVARGSAVSVEGITAPHAAAGVASSALAKGEQRLVTLTVALPDSAAISTPDPELVGDPREPPALSVTAVVTLSGRTLRLLAPVVHSWTDPVHGERIREVSIVPPASVTPVREAVLLPNGRPASVMVRVRAATGQLTGSVDLGLPAGWRSAPAAHAVTLTRAGDEATVSFSVTPPAKAGPTQIAPGITIAGRRWAYREDVIDHPHIPLRLVLTPAVTRLVPVKLALPKGLVGYLPGPGDSVAEDLAHVGVRLEKLDDAALRSGNLARFAAILVGIRAFNTSAAVRAAHARLMDYVKAGGHLVVQYQTNSRLAPLSTPIGPYPLELGRDRITDETAAMVPIAKAHALLQRPNAIGEADFAGWVQERGIYFASKWDAKYQPLWRAADPGEGALEGGTLVARHGKGRYIYTGLAFFRQLPAGVPGAYRLLANFLAR